MSVNDGAATATRTATVVVKTASQAIDDLTAAILNLGLNKGETNSLQVKLAAANRQIREGNTTAATNQLEALINEIAALGNSGRVPAPVAAFLSASVQRIIAAM
jgi:hypothetical protein